MFIKITLILIYRKASEISSSIITTNAKGQLILAAEFGKMFLLL
jgi:hypothetical protein